MPTGSSDHSRFINLLEKYSCVALVTMYEKTDSGVKVMAGITFWILEGMRRRYTIVRYF